MLIAKCGAKEENLSRPFNILLIKRSLKRCQITMMTCLNIETSNQVLAEREFLRFSLTIYSFRFAVFTSRNSVLTYCNNKK